MIKRARWVPVILLGLGGIAGATAPDIMPLEEVRPGQKGYVLTVLAGTDPDSLPVEIVGVTRSGAPEAHLILIRGQAELARTGIAEGMSGSPLFVDGRLVGALAFAFNGAREPIGGVTPATEMAAAIGPHLSDAESPPRSSSGYRRDLPPFPEWRDICASGEALPWQSRSRQPAPGLDVPAGLQRIGVPVLIESSPDVRAALAPVLQAVGLEALPAVEPGMDAAAGECASLAPGDAVAVDLIAGDMHASAIGTVTWVAGRNVFAFGHPFLQGGPVEMPLSKAAIQTIIPTRGVSFKVGTSLAEVGALVADKRTGVGAILGRRAPRIALHLVLRGEQGAPLGEYDFAVVRHELLTPALLSAAVASALTAQTSAMGLAMLASDVSVALTDGRLVRRQDLFRTISPRHTIGAEIMAPVSYLIASTFAEFPVCSVAVTLRHEMELRAVEIEYLRTPKSMVSPGEELTVEVHMRRHRGQREVRQIRLRVPETTPATQLTVMAGSAAAFFEWDRERAPEKYRPRNLDDLVRLIENYPSDETLIVRLYAPSRGIVLRGHELSAVPLSKWHALQGSATGGQSIAVGGRILDEALRRDGDVVLGAAMLRVGVKQ